MCLQVSNSAVTGWLQLAGDASIFIMNEQLYLLGCDLEGHARCLPYELRSLMRVAYLWPSATEHALRAPSIRCAHLCAALIVIHDEYDSRPYEPVTSFQQPKEVTKKGRPPASHLSLCFSTNTGRENAFPTRLSLRLLPAI